jgi:hypothetical protein
MGPAKEFEFDSVIAQLEFGVPPELTVLMRAPFSLSRGECLALADRGIRSPLALAAAQAGILTEVLGKSRAARIQTVCEEADVAHAA